MNHNINKSATKKTIIDSASKQKQCVSLFVKSKERTDNRRLLQLGTTYLYLIYRDVILIHSSLITSLYFMLFRHYIRHLDVIRHHTQVI